MKILLTTILEDTFDREVLNYFLLRMWHEMNIYYKGKVPMPGEYPVYVSKFANNPVYFQTMKENYPVWEPKLEVK